MKSGYTSVYHVAQFDREKKELSKAEDGNTIIGCYLAGLRGIFILPPHLHPQCSLKFYEEHIMKLIRIFI